MKATLTLAAAVAALGLAWLSPAARAADAQPAKAVIAFLGSGHTHSWSYGFYNLSRDKNVRVKYVWDSDAKRAADCATWFGGKAKLVANVAEVFADPEVTGVLICSETSQHHDLVMAAAKTHKAIYVEKPMAITAKEAAEMADAIDKAGVFFTTGYDKRSDPKFRFLKEQVAKGNFGQVTRVLAENCNSAGINHTFDPPANRWMADPKQAGGGGFCDMGTHALDMAMWLGGDVESATGDLSVVAHNYGDTDDCGEALLKFKNGATGVVVGSWVNQSNPIALEIAGTKGHAMIVNGKLFFQTPMCPIRTSPRRCRIKNCRRDSPARSARSSRRPPARRRPPRSRPRRPPPG